MQGRVLVQSVDRPSVPDPPQQGLKPKQTGIPDKLRQAFSPRSAATRIETEMDYIDRSEV